MGLLRWFNKERYKGLGEVLSAIRKELISLQPVDSPDIVWNKTANGMEAVFKGNRGTGATADNNAVSNNTVGGYDGYFKLIAVPYTTSVLVHIVNGADFDLHDSLGTRHGTNVCRINNEYFDVPGNSIEIPTLAENEIKTIYLLLERVVNNTSPVFRYTAELPAEETFETYVVLGRVSATRIWQDSYGIPQILWFSPCVGFEEPEEI